MIKAYTYLFFLLVSFTLSAQKGIQLNTSEAFDGYLLYENRNDTYLVNNCGDIVHEWTGVSGTELHSKLQVDGTLTYISEDEKTLFVLNWDSSLKYRYTVQDNSLHLVYEAILMPNGHYLCLTRRYLSAQDFIDIGFDPSFASFPQRIDGVVEIDPELDEIIWEWNMMDHVIQQRDQNAANYGVLSDNPQLMDMDVLLESFDWQYGESFMINGFDYNPELDQIALSVRKMGEVAIIDHSTTAEEAKGSTGGNSGMGGDIIYRFGNPQNYNRGTADDRILYYQHNPNWIEHGPHKGKLICYNNGLDRPDVTNINDRYSAVPIFDPIEDGSNYVLEDGLAYGPSEPEVNYDRFDSNTFFFSGYTSAAKVLPNGNIMITVGVNGRIFEIDDSGNIVWEYYADGYSGSSYIFRSEKYGLDYPALIDKDLTPTNATVEFPSSDYDCTLFTSSTSLSEEEALVRFRNTDNEVILESDLGRYEVQVLDVMGRRLASMSGERNLNIDITNYQTGTYFLQITNKDQAYAKVWKFIKK